MSGKGRRKFKTPEDMAVAIEAYIQACEAGDELPMITGLCIHIGLCSKQSFYEYEHYDDGAYGDSVKRGRLYVEMAYERHMHREGGHAGPIFALKNFGWTDKSELEIGGSGEPLVVLNDYRGGVSVDDDNPTND